MSRPNGATASSKGPSNVSNKRKVLVHGICARFGADFVHTTQKPTERFRTCSMTACDVLAELTLPNFGVNGVLCGTTLVIRDADPANSRTAVSGGASGSEARHKTRLDLYSIKRDRNHDPWDIRV